MLADYSHYRVLGVSPTATTGEIEEAYKALVKSSHPDRSHRHGSDAEQDTERCMEINRAWQVLRDPGSRRLYDLLGDDGAELSCGEHAVLWKKAATDRFYLQRICIVLAIVVAFLIIFLALACSRAQGSDIAWPVVFIPIWLIDAAAIVIAVEVPILVARLGDHDEADQERLEMRALAASAVLTIWSALTCAACIGHVWWTFIMLPLLAWDVYWLVRGLKEQRKGADGAEAQLAQAPAAKAIGIYRRVWRPLLVLLSGLNFDGALSWSWWIVSLPAWVALGLDIYATVRHLQFEAGAERGAPELLQEHWPAILQHSVAFLTLLLAVLWAGDHVSLPVALIPVFCVLVAATLYCCLWPVMLKQKEAPHEATYGSRSPQRGQTYHASPVHDSPQGHFQAGSPHEYAPDSPDYREDFDPERGRLSGGDNGRDYGTETQQLD
eukprot:TRINITY_DN47409_c0_g1_i1.p1 TRINITY_DN47409_c0_g1~~TRINITY_DN47409_c0_g1_i1.p1  ORF type:complete len:465 (+),score=116.94 TRINITY_DN47409_c0_g1_i1:84-1397(+)